MEVRGNLKFLSQSIFKNTKKYVVDEINITTYNSAFNTDGEVAIKGNIKMEFHIENATYVYFTNSNILITTLNCDEEKIKNIIN
jgi:hypothetical protein